MASAVAVAPTRAKPDPVKRRLRLWLRLLRTTALIERELRQRLRDGYAQTLPRFDLLAALDRAQAEGGAAGLSMGALSQHLMVSNGNVTGVVDRLEAEGLVRRMPHPEDRRTTIVALTEQGDATFAVMAVAHRAWIDELLAGLGDDEVDALIALLEKSKASARRAGAVEGADGPADAER